ncbi:MAG: dephospho-CoA kinase [Candidatus Bruticola sp.]
MINKQKRTAGLVWGLTGGIACGKSTAAEYLRHLGAHIIDCDLISRELMGSGSPLVSRLVDEFGSGILDKAGELRRSYLGRIVFADPDKLQTLNEIVHPAIWKRTFELTAQARLKYPLVFIMAPLLFEHGAEAACAGVLVIDINPDRQLKRLMSRDHLTIFEAKNRVASQMSLAAKAERATILIDNNGSLKALRRQIEDVWQERFAHLYGV